MSLVIFLVLKIDLCYMYICFLLFIVGNILLYCLIVIFKISNFNVVLID